MNRSKLFALPYELSANFLRIILNEPPEYLKDVREIIASERIHLNEQIAALLSMPEQKPIFIIGPWGSGKTFHLHSLEGKLKVKYRYLYRSFFSIGDLKSAYLHLLPHGTRFSMTFCSVFFLGWIYLKFPEAMGRVQGLKNFWLAILITIGFLLITNQMKVFYGVVSLFNIPLCPPRIKLTVIDDLDRSSMSNADQWALLSNLWAVGHRYIVLFGYNSEETKLSIIEKAMKLGGHLVFLPLDPQINQKIAKALDNDLPFGESQWFENITPRDIVQIFTTVDLEARSIESKDYRQLLYLNRYFITLMRNLGVKRSQFDEIRIAVDSFGSNKTISLQAQRTINEGRTLPMDIHQYFGGFRGSIDTKLQELICERFAGSLNAIFKIESLAEIRRILTVVIRANLQTGIK